MKKTLLSLLLVASAAMAEVNWAASYDDALEIAHKSKKHVMIMLSRENCPGCEYMSDIVFEDKVIYDEINKNFVSLYIDINKDFVPDGLGYIGTPTIHFLDSDGKKIGRQDGAANIPNFLGVIGKNKPKK